MPILTGTKTLRRRCSGTTPTRYFAEIERKRNKTGAENCRKHSIADLTTSKLLWNSVLSTEGARYTCLDIKNFYLTAALDYYEYMKIPLALFPEWIKKQYNQNTHATNGFVFLEIRRAVWGLPQAGILANKLL